VIKFCNIKEGLEVEGKYKGIKTLFLTLRYHMDYTGEKLYDPDTIIEEIYSPALYPAVYLLDERVASDPDGADYTEVIDIVNFFLKYSMVSYEVGEEQSLRLYTIENYVEAHNHTFNYVCSSIMFARSSFMDKEGKIQTFVKFQTEKEVFIQQIQPYGMIRNNKEDEKNDIQLLPRE